MTRQDDGFTLVEILIALALLGMLTTLAYGVVRFGAFAWRHNTEQRDADAERGATIRLLRQAIKGAYPAFASPEYADRRISFDGLADQLALVTPLPEAIEAGVMAREVFAIRTEGESRGLSMAWALDLHAARGGVLPMHKVQLAADIGILRFAYFGQVQPDQPATWSENWSGMTTLPELVRVQAWRVGATQLPWLDVTVETRTTTNTDCVYLAQEPVCRRLE